MTFLGRIEQFSLDEGVFLRIHERVNHLVAVARKNLDLLRSRPVIFFGGGPNLKSTIDTCISLNCEILGFYDQRYENEAAETFCKRISQERMDTYSFSDVTLVVVPGLNELYGDIVHQQFFYHRILHRRLIEASIFFSTPENAEGLKECAFLLQDEISVDQYLGRVERVLAGVMFDNAFQLSNEPYFDNDVVKRLNLNWMYAGLFNGKHFLRALKNSEVKLCGVEPSKHMFETCQRQFADEDRVRLENFLLWNIDNEQIPFNDDALHGGVAASVDNHSSFGANYTVETRRVDSIIEPHIEYLAIDVEGTEQKVLEGALVSMEQQLKTVAVCLYHNWSDCISIPKQLSRLHGGCLHVRQHSSIPFIENVCYSVRK